MDFYPKTLSAMTTGGTHNKALPINGGYELFIGMEQLHFDNVIPWLKSYIKSLMQNLYDHLLRSLSKII